MAEVEVGQHNRPWRLKFHIHHHDDERRASTAPTTFAHKEDKHEDLRRASLASPAMKKVVLTHHGPAAPASKLKVKFVPIDFTKNIPTDIPYPPFVHVEGVPNFRDCGGFTCHPPSSQYDPQQKYHMRQGYAYRCSELSQITPKGDATMTDTIKTRVLYDLRSEAEAANPRGQPKGVECISTPVFYQRDMTLSLGVQQLKWSTAPDKSKSAGYSQGYVDWYRQIAAYGAKHAYRVIFAHIRDKPEEPFVFHCTAGKDRTGVFSALLLKLCGVDDATVAWEYSLTVPGMGVWEEMVESEMIGDSMMPIRSHDGMTKEEAHRVCGSRASNMAHWLKAVLEEEFGGVEKYLMHNCSFKQEDVDKIRKNLIAEGEGPIKVVELKSADHGQT